MEAGLESSYPSLVSSSTSHASQEAPPPSSLHPNSTSTPQGLSSHSPALSTNDSSTLADSALSFDPEHPDPSIPRYHVRAPSNALRLDTDFSSYLTQRPSDTNLSPANLEGNGSEPPRQSATAPIAIQDGTFLRSTWSTGSIGSLSPGSALSSPALNALGDITPLPSPLVMNDSPGPWQRAVPRPRSRGTSGSYREDAFAMFKQGGLSPSPSLKKKGYQRLQTAAVEGAAAANAHARERNRSLSEYTPETMLTTRPRNVTIGSVSIEGDTNVQHLHREAYLATQRGLVPAKVPTGLPTPPASNASNASNRSVTDTEEDDISEEDKSKYIVVRHGPQKIKKLWRPVRQLGQGTFSKVYLATCEATTAKDPLDENILDPHKLVAIKVCEHGPAGGADEERVELSLKREVEMLRSVSHPSLVNLQAFDHDDNQALIVLTYCPGGDLFDVASAHSNILTPAIVQRIFAEMVSAVRYLHTQLIVHRDIKLESISAHVTHIMVLY